MRLLKTVLGATIAALAAGPVVAAGASPQGPRLPAAPAAARATTVPACGPGQIAVWIDPQGEGAAGSTYFHLRFTNVSVHTCSLTGYPGVSAVNATGRILGSPARRSPVHPPTRVTLTAARVAAGGPVALGATVTVILRIAQVQNFPSSRCGRATASGLRIYPPGQRVARLVSFPFLACAKTGAPYLSVEAVQP